MSAPISCSNRRTKRDSENDSPYALDVTTITPNVATPDPATLLLLGTGLLAVYSKKRQHRRRLVLGPVKLSAQS